MLSNRKVGHKILVEGIDGAGKTTYIESLKAHPSYKDYKVIHCTRHTPNTFEWFRDLLLSDDKLILDRSQYGQFIYQTKQERFERNQLTLKELVQLEDIMNTYEFDLVYVYADLQTCLNNCLKDEEDSYYTLGYLDELDTKYRYLFDNISGVNRISSYHNKYINIEDTIDESTEIDYKSFDYTSLPKIVAVDFDGTLVKGDNYPDIGELNTKLVDELYNGKYKDWKKILFTNRSHDDLIKACNFLADNNIYFDAVNDDLEEVKKSLNRSAVTHRKIWFDVLIDDKAENIERYL